MEWGEVWKVGRLPKALKGRKCILSTVLCTYKCIHVYAINPGGLNIYYTLDFAFCQVLFAGLALISVFYYYIVYIQDILLYL